MRKINKQQPIPDFSKIINSANNWDEINDNTAKQACRDHILIIEQNGLSAYTEQNIIDSNSLHIDHYIKRSLDQKQTFIWNNLLVDNKDSNFGSDHKDNIIKNLSMYDNLFNPVKDNVQQYFYYALSGRIEPIPNANNKIKEKVNYTVNIFNLNHNTLSEIRASLINNIKNMKNGGCDNETIQECLKDYGFPSLIQQYINFPFPPP